jgi:hypothetical protein
LKPETSILVGDLGGLENLLKNIKKLLPVSRQVTINVLKYKMLI